MLNVSMQREEDGRWMSCKNYILKQSKKPKHAKAELTGQLAGADESARAGLEQQIAEQDEVIIGFERMMAGANAVETQAEADGATPDSAQQRVLDALAANGQEPYSSENK